VTSTLRELVAARENDYAGLARRYLAATGGQLVVDPLGSPAKGPARVTRSVSVLIGAHNSARSLVPALVSLEHGSFNRRHPERLEVIVVDDGSTDATRETLLGLELDLDWRYVRQNRGGLTSAHNTGLAFAEGDVIVFSDADVIHHPFALEELAKRHEVLDGVTLTGFRHDVAPDDPRLARDRLPAALRACPPAFWADFRLSFPGRPSNMMRDTGHLAAFGRGRRVWAANGAGYDLAGMVVGAFFSIGREELPSFGGSDERLAGWGCEDSLIGARSLATGNAIVPVYSATAWHVWHPRRDPDESVQFRRNLATLERIYDEPFTTRRPALAAWRGRALEVVAPRHAARRRAPALARPALDDLAHGQACEALGRFEPALAAYERAGPAAALGRAHCLLELGRYEAAVAAAEEALPHAPDSGPAWLALALALGAGGGYGDARRVLERRAAAPDPPFEVTWALGTGAERHKRRGNEHARQGLHRMAVTDLDLALIADPVHVWSHFDRSVSLRRLGRATEALAALRRCDALLHAEDGNRTWVHSSLASVHHELGHHAAAAAERDRALRLYPGNDEARALPLG
jgi:tetratricopeptide (TPR) repeat protein